MYRWSGGDGEEKIWRWRQRWNKAIRAEFWNLKWIVEVDDRGRCGCEG